MKKKICDLKPGTPFKCKEQVFIKDKAFVVMRLTDGEVFDPYCEYFKSREGTLVTVCKRIKKSDIKEQK